MSDQVISYGPRARPLRKHSLDVLRDIMRESGIDFLIVSSTARLDVDQARIMYDNIVHFGVNHQKKLYGPNGDAVIDVFAVCREKKMTLEQTIAAMLKKIREIGPEKVSKHCANPDVLEVFDVSPASIPTEKRAAFEKAAREHPQVAKVLGPANSDPAYHIEVRQPKVDAPATA
jgi:hypothetical protein